MKAQLEKITLGKYKSILAFNYSESYFNAPWHFHPQHELTLIKQSFGTKFIGDYVGTFEPGELVLLRANVPHCWKNSMEQPSGAESIVIQWNKGVYSKVPELNLVFNMIFDASKGVIFNKEDTKNLIELIERLPNLEGNELYVNHLMLLSELSKCKYKTLSHSSFTDDIPTQYGNRIRKIHNYVEANYKNKIKLKDLAVLVNMSEQSFSRFFSKMMKKPFFYFLNEYRINIASRMLIDTDLPVAQVGYSCGYESLPFFFKQFGKFKGITPYQYRKKYKIESVLE